MDKRYLYYGLGAVAGVAIIYFITRAIQQRFDLSQFDSPDQKGSGKLMDKQFLSMLRKAEKYAGFRFNYISGYRTENHNRVVGGVKDSAHTKGLAVDIQAISIAMRDKIVAAAKTAGFKRIGIGRLSVHLDNDLSKPLYVAWGYPLGSNPPFNPFAKRA